MVYKILGEDANGKLIGRHQSTGIGRPQMWERARYYNEEQRLASRPSTAWKSPTMPHGLTQTGGSSRWT